MDAIFILGAGVMQGPAIRAARDKGLYVVVADGDPGAACRAEADRFVHIDLKDKPALLEAARGIPGLKGVFTAGTDFSASVAYVAEGLGLPGIGHEAALDASDKGRMRVRLKAAGVPVPAFAVGTGTEGPAAALAELTGSGALFPFVVKPVDNMGARGCRLARDEAEFALAWAAAAASSRSGRVIAEEYLEGPEFSLDALIYEGEFRLRGVADRQVRFEPYFVELGHTMPSAYGPEVLDEVIAVFKAGAKALGIERGATKGDIKYTRRGAFVGEIAARLSGGYMSGWTYPYASGVDPASEGVDLACGRHVRFAEASRDWCSAERAFISIPGELMELRGLDKARRLPYVKDLFSRCAPGDRLVFPSNNVQKAGNVISQAPTRAEAEAAAEEGARSLALRLRPGDPETAAFLGYGRPVADDWSWAPDAYAPSAMAIAYVDSLPELLKADGEKRSVGIEPLPGMDREGSRDWLGRSMAEGLELVRSLSGAAVGPGDIVLGRAFWRAFFRGGYQGGAWAVDTMVKELRKA